MISDQSKNDEQIAFWNGPRGEEWVKEQEAMDRALEPFGRAALERAEPRAGEHAIDVGCGCGATTLALAAAVGPSGGVVGVDVSAPMLARARERARGLAHVTFVEGDAAAHAFERRADLVFSRFGVMFFADPAAAFANLRGALSPRGRAAFVCWRKLADNPWLGVPLAAAKRIVPPLEPPPPADAPGPLAFADPDRVRAILERAGFVEAAIAPFDHRMPLGDGRGLDAAVEHAITIGPTARLIAVANPDAATLARVRREVREALAPHADASGVSFPAGAWIVTARASAGHV
ncbi:MAG TPA: methyltransferase domain-containing protein [Polyangia bacterium]|nr:methyltransferase domain-containing protein [Polyangia bacterium]